MKAFRETPHRSRSGWSSWLKRFFLLEAGAAILFFGALVHQAGLIGQGTTALNELAALGYAVPTDADPMRVYPGITGGPFGTSHAGGWRPGVISLREHPAGTYDSGTYLRHELMHEANFRTCGGRLPLWAEEASAMSFSGQLRDLSPVEIPSQAESDHLREKIRVAAPLDEESRRTLSKLIAYYGWPSEPCAVSEKIEKWVSHSAGAIKKESGFSYILISLTSGRILESKGDLDTRFPPGSLLKIPYAAALRTDVMDPVGEALADSNASALLKMKGAFDPGRYRLLISTISRNTLGKKISDKEMGGKDDSFWRQYLGERSPDGGFPLEANLRELSLMLRASLLFRPEMFKGLSRNGFEEETTLFREPEKDKRVLGELHALSKTGTASDERQSPLAGHLMVAWPLEAPTLMAIFRTIGVNGASNIRPASKILESWSSRYAKGWGNVRVRLLGLVPRSSWRVRDECAGFTKDLEGSLEQAVSLCGRFGIVSSSRGSRTERTVSGILEHTRDDETILITDPETYADSVMLSEAQDLKGEALKALRAVIVGNGVHGSDRHPKTASLCDTTHCMVFQGSLPTEIQKKSSLRLECRTDQKAISALQQISATKEISWFLFSKGGADRWSRAITSSDLGKLVDEEMILDIRRERTRNGEVRVHLFYGENEETVPCEHFRNQLKLLSCPDRIYHDADGPYWIFEGLGEGHGLGLSIERAKALSNAGHDASMILKDAYLMK